MIKFGRLLIIFLMILTAGGMAQAQPLCREVFGFKLKRASIAERLLSNLVLTQIMLSDPIAIAPLSWRKAWMDRRRAKEALKVLAGSSHQEIPVSFRLLSMKSPSWGLTQIRIGKPGTAFTGPSQKFSIEMLKSYLQSRLGKRGAVTLQLIDAFNNRDQVMKWAEGLKIEAADRMKADGIDYGQAYGKPELVEFYFDMILAERARQHGFSVNSKGGPHNLVTFNEPSFFWGHLARGHVFIDWTGIDLSASSDKSSHFARGHLLQMVYAAEHVPGFVDLIKYIGLSFNREDLWSMLFDNTKETESPFWGGFWVYNLGDFLGIRY